MMTNKYCQALAALRSKPAHELKEVGDQWRTPDLLFWGINALFGPLVLNLFAICGERPRETDPAFSSEREHLLARP